MRGSGSRDASPERIGQLFRRCRAGEVRCGRDDDDQLGLVALPVGRAEQRAQDRQVRRPGHLVDGVGVVLLEEAGDGEALAVAQLDRGGGLAHGERRHLKPWMLTPLRWVELR